ncbi:MAG: peptidyl-prolyl cis-trans isomerase SurA [Thiomicrorhabdus sp.]|nr:MAG: peptidyl-prolyl cis-trans isomerase SurA [Thiomicrorhabdus sp.]
MNQNQNQNSFFQKSFFQKPVLVAFLATMVSLSLSPSVTAETLIDRVVAVVDNQIILKSELNTHTFAKEQELAAQNIQAPNPKILREKVLEAMILERLQVERARQIGIEVLDEEINTQLNVIAKQNSLTLIALRKRLDLEMANGFNKFRKQIETKILIQKLREAEVISQTYVSKTEVDNYLKRQSLDTRNEEVELGHLLVAIPESSTPNQRTMALNKITDIHQRIKNGEDFEQLAIRHSNGSKALNGGNLGWFKQSDVPTFFAQAINGLATGEVSDVIKSPSGFHLIKLINKKSAGVKIMKNFHLRRFLVPNDNVSAGEVPSELMIASQSLRSLTDFNNLHNEFPGILPNVNANDDLGWKTAEELPKELRSDLVNLKVNRALLPIPTSSGWMILFLQETKNIEQPYTAKAKDAIQAIRMRKANAMFELWLRRLKDEAFIEIRLNENTQSL